MLLSYVTAIILLVIEEPKLEAVVTPAHQPCHAVRVVVAAGAVRLGLTVSLAQSAWGLHRAAGSLLLVVPAPAPLAIRLFQR